MTKLSFSLLILCLLMGLQCRSQIDAFSKHFNTDDNIILEGYDPVSYFSNNPKEGKSNFKYKYEGVTYLFANPANLAKFKEKPSQYKPAYGGWCAYAMGKTGEKVKIDPETYKIVNGKLYLFYNFWGNNTLTDWNKNEALLRSKADQNWKKWTQ